VGYDRPDTRFATTLLLKGPYSNLVLFLLLRTLTEMTAGDAPQPMVGAHPTRCPPRKAVESCCRVAASNRRPLVALGSR
jgi:hypothetical protein